MRSRIALRWTVGLVLLTGQVQSAGPYNSLGDLFDGKLANITDGVPGNMALGGQDFGHCCALAINQSLEIVDGNVQFKPNQTFLPGPASVFVSSPFPCTASYNGSAAGGPEVRIPYSWCRANCNGWAKTKTTRQSDWLEPFVSYILPTVVFCFTIPRRKAFFTPSAVFPDVGLLNFPRNLTLLYRLPLAAILILFDTAQWVVVCIVMAGPMLLAGIFEGVIDARIMNYLGSHGRRLSPRRRAHLLLVVLIGNLDGDPAWEHSRKLLGDLPDVPHGIGEKSHVAPPEPADSEGSTGTEGKNGRIDNKIGSSSGAESERPTTPSPSLAAAARIVKRQLTSLVESPTPFGTAVGIGVLFFSTSFFYNINDIQKNYGNGGTSHSLAFGCFWMTIGHIAVVAGVLAANPNPSVWEAVAADLDAAHIDSVFPPAKNLEPQSSNSLVAFLRAWWTSPRNQRGELRRPALLTTRATFRSGFSSRYKVAWMWDRGLYKARWLARFADEYGDPDAENQILCIRWTQLLFLVVLPAILLFFIPAFLGGMTSYTTPTVGLSCRSMIPLVYMVSQFLLISAWLCYWKLWCVGEDCRLITLQADNKNLRSRYPLADVAWYVVFGLGISGAVFSAIGGTAFHLMGLFRNCLCWISIWDWSNRNSPNTTMNLAGGVAAGIYYAERFWISIGVSATLFLILTTYFGWQYQHRMRTDFRKMIDGIDHA